MRFSDLGDGAQITLVLVAMAILGLASYFLFFAGDDTGGKYVFWDGTVTLVWLDAAAADTDYGVGRGRYEVRLINGKHVEARTYLDESLVLYDCVRIRQRIKLFSFAPTFEIVGRTDDCWQPTSQ